MRYGQGCPVPQQPVHNLPNPGAREIIMRNPVFALMVGAGAMAATTLAAAATDPAGLRAQASVFFETIPEEVTELRGESLSPEQVELRSEELTSELQSRGHLVCRLP